MTTAYEFKLNADDFESVIRDNLVLQNENIELRTRLDSANVECENLRSHNEKLEHEQLQSETQMKTATLQLNKQFDRIKILENEVYYLRYQTDDNLNYTVLQMHYKLQEVKSDQSLPLLQQKLELLQGQLSDAKQFNAKADYLIYDVRKQLASQIGETERFRSLNFVQEIKISENTKLITKLQDENEALQKQIIELQNQSLTTSQSEVSVKFASMKYEPLDKLLIKIDYKDRRISELYLAIEQCQAQTSRDRERIAHIETENQQFQQYIRTADATRMAESNQIRYYYELQVQQLQFEAARLHEQIAKLEQRTKKADQENAALQAENDKVRAEMGRKIIKCQQAQLADLDEVMEENKASKAVISQLQADLTACQRENQEKNDKVDKLRKKIAHYKYQVAEAYSVVFQLKAALFGMTQPAGSSSALGGTDKINQIMKQIKSIQNGSYDANEPSGPERADAAARE